MPCPTCGKRKHNFQKEEAFSCVPPRNCTQFGDYVLSKKYRAVMYNKHPHWTVEEVIGAYLGYAPNFPSEEEWYDQSEI